MTYSIIVAVFNRPQELHELLESLTTQTLKDFEVVVVEDGSTITSRDVCNIYASQLNIRYFEKTNSGPGPSRNYGCRRASGDVFIFLDSDCTVSPDYMLSVDKGMRENKLDAFGGPDREHDSFTPMQKAINYAMTSVFTTGGIRGGKKNITGKFHPRSFNMGISREVFNETDGFSSMRFGEDIDLSIRIIKAGFKTGLLQDAWVYHKRRTDLKKFFKQVHNSGIARINLSLRHAGTLKIPHYFPAAFTIYTFIALAYTPMTHNGWYGLLPLALYELMILIHATLLMKSVSIGLLSVVASYVQLIGYGTGFIRGFVLRILLNKPEMHAFEKTLYS